MKIIDINKTNNKVTIILEGYDGKHQVEFVNRYIVHVINRWDFVQDEILRYFINEGRKGCLIGSGFDYYSVEKRFYITHPSDILIWDLHYVFPEIDFIDNKDSIKNEVIKETLSETINWWGK